MITVCELTKRFGRFVAVDRVSFTVDGGEAVALWGPNGAGKTTIIRCMLGLLRFSGRITVAGRDLGKATRAATGYVAQELAFHDDMRVRDAVRFYARLRRAPRGRPMQVLEHVDLSEHAAKRVRELSGGMKQRLALALALLSDPPVLLLDELTANLDASARASFLGLLRDQRAAGKTIVFSSHRMEEVEMLADRVIALRRGRIELECPPPDLGRALDLRCVLKLWIAQEALEPALRVLEERRYHVTRNGVGGHGGHGLLVEVPIHDKTGPIGALLQERIVVRDFELTHDGRPCPAGEVSRG